MAMDEPRLIKPFKAWGVKKNNIKVASHFQHSRRVETTASFTKYRTRPERDTDTFKLGFCRNSLSLGELAGHSSERKSNSALESDGGSEMKPLAQDEDETKNSPKTILLPGWG